MEKSVFEYINELMYKYFHKRKGIKKYMKDKDKKTMDKNLTKILPVLKGIKY